MSLDEYYAAVPDASKKQLADLRQLIISVLDEPEELISYQIPHFTVGGKRIVAIGGYKAHVALYPLSATILPMFAAQLAGYKVSAGTVQFPLSRPLPTELIRAIVQGRLAEMQQ